MQAKTRFLNCSQCPQAICLTSYKKIKDGAGCRLISIVSPKGSGKTAWLQRWAAHCLNENGLQAAWVSLSCSDNQPQTFYRNLITSIDRVIPGITGNGEIDEPFDLNESIEELINLLAVKAEEMVLIFDQYHVIESPEIHAAVRLMLDYLPEQVRMVIASRSEPPLPLPRLRVRRQVIELSANDLKRFDPG